MYKMKTEDSSSHFLTINFILILNFKKVSRILYWKSSHYNYLLKLKNLHTFTHHIFTKGSTLDHGLNSRNVTFGIRECICQIRDRDLLYTLRR